MLAVLNGMGSGTKLKSIPMDHQLIVIYVLQVFHWDHLRIMLLTLMVGLVSEFLNWHPVNSLANHQEMIVS